MRRGEVRAYAPVLARPGQSLLRLIVPADAVNANDELPTVLGLHVKDSDPGNLLSVRLGAHGWATALSIEAVMRRRLGDLVYVASEDEMESVANALRAAQEL